MARRAIDPRKLLGNFKRIRSEWPLDESRGNRDLGHYIQGAYAKRFRENMKVVQETGQGAAAMEAELTALENLHKNVYKDKYSDPGDCFVGCRGSDLVILCLPRRYKRATNSSFSGEYGAGRFGWAQLSEKAQKLANSQSWLDKLFRRKLQSQQSDSTKYKDDM
eukprot:m.108040 g.108040  ORF g.108040 m.108040 type:complete len:164 (+) comp16943_c0_seq3:356-847(+)